VSSIEARRLADAVTRVHSDHMDGSVHPDFAELAVVFARQLRRTTGGAALAVYHRGELVVDLWGGMRTPGTPWQRDTVAMCFSTTKGVASFAVHLLADRGEIDYDAPVSRYWPQFAQAGKSVVTVRHVLTHSAGLHRIRTLIDHADRMLDWEYMVNALERAEPVYPPGTRHGYHAFTYGWLTGELVRRVSGRPIAQFVDEEVAGPLGLDGLTIGCPPDRRDRIAPLEPIGVPIARRFGLQQGVSLMGGPIGSAPALIGLPVNLRRIANALMPRGIEDVLWGPEVMDAAIPAANGFFTARSLAKMYALLAGRGEIDGCRLLRESTVDKIGVVHSRGPDLVVVVPMSWRLGYHFAATTSGSVSTGYGHFGFGGSGGWADPKSQLAIAMVCNRGGGTPIGDLRIARLGAVAVSAAQRREAGPGGQRSGRAALDLPA
jgi:CubicO group peptidase (beta-lactamase class C family)